MASSEQDRLTPELRRVRRRTVLLTAALACVAVAAGLYAVRFARSSSDSIGYELVARQVRAGNGLRRPDFYLLDEPDERGTVPFAFQPPLIPLLLAPMGEITVDRYWPWLAVNVAAHAVSVLIVLCLVRRLSGDRAATAAAVLVAVGYPFLNVVRFLWSESLFLALFLTTLALLELSRRRPSRWPVDLLSGVTAALALSARFVGVGLAPAFGWELVRRWRREGLRSAARGAALMGMLPALCVGLMWGRNLKLTGSVRGFVQHAPGRSVFEAAVGLARAFFQQLGIAGASGRSFVQLGALLALAGVPAVLLLARARGRSRLVELADRGMDLVLAAALGYIALLLVALVRGQPEVESRFALPLVPLAVIIGVALAAEGWGATSRDGRRRLAAFGVAVSLLLTGAHAVGQSVRDLPPTRMWGDLGDAASPTLEWLHRNCPPGTVVATNAALPAAFVARRSAMRPQPSYGYVEYTITPQGTGVAFADSPYGRIDMEELLLRRMDAVGAEHLVLLTSSEGFPERYAGSFIAALSRREAVCPRLELVWEADDGVAYRLLDEAGSAPPEGDRP